MSSIDTFLSQQAEGLELEKRRQNGRPASNNGADDQSENGELLHADAGSNGADGDHFDDSVSVQSSDQKLKKDAINSAMYGGADDVPPSNRKLSQKVHENGNHAADSFYSHFPSYTDQNKQREQLVSNRHQDYRDHLTMIAQKEADETKRKQQKKLNYDNDHRESTLHQHQPTQGNSANHHNSTNSPTDHWAMQDDLKHSSTGQNQEHSSIIKDSNDEYAQDANRRKVEYQRDLMKQIEDKKQEVKALRAREIAEDAKMTKQLEEQLRSIQLEEQLRKERKRSEQVRIEVQQKHLFRLHMLAKLNNGDATTSQNLRTRSNNGSSVEQLQPWMRTSRRIADDQSIAGTHSSHHIDDDDDDDNDDSDDVFAHQLNAFDPRKAYKYFSNSARPTSPVASRRRGGPPHAPIQAFVEQPATGRHRTTTSPITANDYCKRCLSHLTRKQLQQQQQLAAPDTTNQMPATTVCNYCERRRLMLPINEDFCLNCSVLLATHAERQNGMCTNCRRTDLRCGFCQKHIDVCPTCRVVFCLRCHRRQQQLEHVNTDCDGLSLGLPGNEENFQPAIKYARPTRTHPDDERPIIPHERRVAALRKSLERSTIVDHGDQHRLRPRWPVGEKPFSTNVSPTSVFHPNARLDAPKLALNIRHGQVFVDQNASKYTTSYDAFPVPLMPPPYVATIPSRSSPAQASQKPTSSEAVLRLQQKWEIPAVQKNVISIAKQPTQRVLTQLGAIRRQLQLEKMELDDA